METARALERIFNKPPGKEKSPRRFFLIRGKAEKGETTPDPVALFKEEQVRSLSERIITESETMFRDIETELGEITHQAHKQAPIVMEDRADRVRSIKLLHVDGTTINLTRGSSGRVDYFQMKEEVLPSGNPGGDNASDESFARAEYSSESGRYAVLHDEGRESANVTKLQELHDYIFNSRIIDLRTDGYRSVRRTLEQ